MKVYFLWVCVFAFLQCTPLCHCFKCLTCSLSIFSSSLLYSLTWAQVLHYCSGTKSDSLDKWTLDTVEFLPWTFLPRRALSCLSFLHQPLMSTLHCRNLIFVPIKFNICQWVQRFLRWGKVEYCISRHHAKTNLNLREKKKSLSSRKKLVYTYSKKNHSIHSFCLWFCALLSLC